MTRKKAHEHGERRCLDILRQLSAYIDDELPEDICVRPGLSFQFEMIAEGLPVMLVDGLYQRADEICEAALSLDDQRCLYYPGTVAAAPRDNPSLNRFLGEIQALVNSQYLPQVLIAADGQRITNFTRMHTDFARVDMHPDDLRPPQRGPHIDPIPIFGLVYLNREELAAVPCSSGTPGSWIWRPRHNGTKRKAAAAMSFADELNRSSIASRSIRDLSTTARKSTAGSKPRVVYKPAIDAATDVLLSLRAAGASLKLSLGRGFDPPARSRPRCAERSVAAHRHPA